MKYKDLKINFRHLSGNIACLSVNSISGEIVHNDINDEEAIIIIKSLVGKKENCQTVKSLLEENEKLKKELEEMDRKLFFTKNELDMRQKSIDNKLNQQQEFIKYMKNIIEELECDDADDEEMRGYLFQRIDTFKEILQKYKEIIGETNE